MKVRSNGDLVPHLTGTCSRHCKICLEVCPFFKGLHDPREKNIECFGPPSENLKSSIQSIQQNQVSFHNDAGWYLRSIVGYSENHRPGSASGGLLTMVLEKLLTTNKVDRVAVVGNSLPDNGSLFHFKSVSSVNELRACAGSVYYPVEISHLVREMVERPTVRWAVVGVPCLCAALRKAVSLLPKLQHSVQYILGMACGMYQNRMYTEMLIKASGLIPEDVTKVKYRVKNTKGPANNFGFNAETQQGKEGKLIPYHGLPFFLGSNAYFRCNACNFCKDVFAENADACFMDAWLPEYLSDPKGASLVLIRNSSLDRLFTEVDEEKNGLVIKDISIERLVSSQFGHIRRKRQLINLRMGEKVDGFKCTDHFEWWLQRCTQNRSKMAWACFGRKYGIGLFWLAMSDLLIIQKGYLLLKIVFRFPLRLKRKIIGLKIKGGVFGE